MISRGWKRRREGVDVDCGSEFVFHPRERIAVCPLAVDVPCACFTAGTRSAFTAGTREWVVGGDMGRLKEAVIKILSGGRLLKNRLGD